MNKGVHYRRYRVFERIPHLLLAGLVSTLVCMWPNGSFSQEQPCVKLRDGAEVCPKAQRQPSDPPPSAVVKKGRIYVENKCHVPFRIALRYKMISDEWKTVSWYTFSPDEFSSLDDDDRTVETDNAVFYYYAEAEGGRKWRGRDDDDSARTYTIEGERYRFRKYSAKRDDDGDWRLALTCRR